MNEMNEKIDEPQGEVPESPPLLEMSPNELANILEAHRKWVESEGKEGERADLVEANLQEADLDGANLQGAYLVEANLQGAFFEAAKLQGATLGRANLQNVNLRRANLQGANLGGAWGLTPFQVKVAKNWELAFYSDDLLKELGLPLDHNERVKEKLAETEKEKKASGSK